MTSLVAFVSIHNHHIIPIKIFYFHVNIFVVYIFLRILFLSANEVTPNIFLLYALLFIYLFLTIFIFY